MWTIVESYNPIETDDVYFIGTLKPLNLVDEDDYWNDDEEEDDDDDEEEDDDEKVWILYLGENNMLYYPNGPMAIGSFRAYFQLKIGLVCGEPADPVNGINNFVLNFGGEGTGIGEIANLKSQTSISTSWYTLDGRKLSGKPKAKGIYINNGRKVVIK